MTQDIIGVDIAKEWIDIHRLSDGRGRRIRCAAAQLERFASEASGALVVFEASGGYERPLTEALAGAGAPFARVNPRHAREFARIGRALELAPDRPERQAQLRLAALVARSVSLTRSSPAPGRSPAASRPCARTGR